MEKFRFFQLFLILAISIGSSQCFRTYVDLDERYHVNWGLTEDGTELDMVAEVKTKGFIGLGFSWNGAMDGADIIVGGVRDNGEAYLDDYHGVGQVKPVLDEMQNYKLISASENATHTRIHFTRPLITCDEFDLKIGEDTVKIIWSIGSTDELQYHGSTNRGVRAIFMLDPDLNPPPLPDMKVYEFHTNITMPSRATTYWCSIHKTPLLDKKHHMIAVEPILEDPEALRHIHHMNVLKCFYIPGLTGQFEEWEGKEGTDCHNPDPTFPDANCLFLEFGWAIGGGMTTNPPDVGFPFESEVYFKLEVHYDNPTQRENIQFSTGLRIHYTDELRPIDGSQFMVVSTTDYHLMIPPNMPNFVNVAHCPGVCTDWFPDTGIKIYSVFLHAHISARKMRVRHFRRGVELPWIVNDEFYDFNYQQNRRLRQEVHFMPGDQVTLECTYDSTWNNGSTVIGGSTTHDEMCMGFLAYYPRVDTFIGCGSLPTDRNILGFFGIERIEIGPRNPQILAPDHFVGKRFTDVVEEFEWTDEKRAEYQRIHMYEPQAGICLPMLPVFVTSYPHTNGTYAPPQDKCDDLDESSTEPDSEGPTDPPGGGGTGSAIKSTFGLILGLSLYLLREY